MEHQARDIQADMGTTAQVLDILIRATTVAAVQIMAVVVVVAQDQKD
jgi:hypothetical protein